MPAGQCRRVAFSKKFKFVKLWQLLKALAVLALIAVFARPGAAETLRLGYSGATASQLAGALAVEQKLFELYGVAVELNQSAGLTMIRAVESGSLDVVIVGGGQALAAYMKGADVRIVSGLVNTVPFQLWAKPDIGQLADLKGRLVADTPPGTSLDLGTRIMLARAGLDPARDVRLVAFGRLQLVSRALLGGVVDAALLSAPETLEARKAGMRMLLDLAAERVPCLFTSVVTSRAVLGKSPAALERFLKAILHGVKLALTNPDMAKKSLGRTLRLTDREALDETYRQAAAAYEPLPLVRRDALETVARIAAEKSSRDPYGVVDMSILERIDKEGFVKTLYTKP
jgi:NitT/TauT family transport system substrate-binding protein